MIHTLNKTIDSGINFSLDHYAEITSHSCTVQKIHY